MFIVAGRGHSKAFAESQHSVLAAGGSEAAGVICHIDNLRRGAGDHGLGLLHSQATPLHGSKFDNVSCRYLSAFSKAGCCGRWLH